MDLWVSDRMYNLLIEICVNFILNRNIKLLKPDRMNTIFKIIFYQKIFPIFYDALNKEYINKMIEYTNKIQVKRITNLIEQAAELNNINNNICICKGFVLSQILYDNPYMRMFNDIDISVFSDNMLSQCLKMEQLGYRCSQVELLKDKINLKQEYINMYYSFTGEKKFNRHNDEAMVEVKNLDHFIDYLRNDQSLERSVAININGHKFKTFNLEDSFILCFENMYDNFFYPWGIKTEHTLRDIVDMTTFMIKYPELFTENFLNSLKKEKRLTRLSKIVNIIKTVFSSYPELIDKLPQKLLDILPEVDDKISKEVLLYRIFEPEKRIAEWKELSYKKIIEGEKRYFQANNLSQTCYDYTKGFVELIHPCIMDRIVNSSLRAPICFSSDYDDKNLIFSFCISKKYPALQLYLSLLRENTANSYEDEIILTFLDDGGIKIEKCDIAVETYVTDCDDCFILSVVINKDNVSLFRKEKFYEVYFSFKWFFFDENIHSENYIAASTNREQAAFRIPV